MGYSLPLSLSLCDPVKAATQGSSPASRETLKERFQFFRVNSYADRQRLSRLRVHSTR